MFGLLDCWIAGIHDIDKTSLALHKSKTGSSFMTVSRFAFIKILVTFISLIYYKAVLSIIKIQSHKSRPSI